MAARTSFKGDFRKLTHLRRGFNRVASPEFKTALTADLSRDALELAHEGFDRSVNPYGRPWKRLKYREGQPLRDTRRLEASLRPFSSENAFGLTTNVLYAATHQWGRGHVPQRMFVPNASEGFGGRWRRQFESTTTRHIREALRRR